MILLQCPHGSSYGARAMASENLEKRFGERVELSIPAELTVAGQAFAGTIRNVGPRGVAFRAPGLRASGETRGILNGASGDVEVRICWTQGPDVGLAFEHPSDWN